LKRHFKKAILAIMKKASITEAKNNLSALIDSVKGGSPVLIVDRGRPVARPNRSAPFVPMTTVDCRASCARALCDQRVGRRQRIFSPPSRRG